MDILILQKNTGHAGAQHRLARMLQSDTFKSVRGAVDLLFLQKRASRAGAQTSLARMVQSATLRPLRPAVLLGANGWLGTELISREIANVVTAFPSPRALPSRLLGLSRFARHTARRLESSSIRPRALVANDHQECPLALALSRQLGNLPVLAILRTPGMSNRDYYKYRCNECHGLMAEGTDLLEKVRAWTDKDVALFEEGFTEDEFHSPKPPPAGFPDRILVIGSEAPRKGFTDFIEALDLIESNHRDFPGLHCDFTGTEPADAGDLLARPRRSSFKFLGRVDGFAKLVRGYDLAIHPSRAESFGMAPLEAILAGVPTLVSTTGIIASLPFPDSWAFPPKSPPEIATRLAHLWKQWNVSPLDLAALQSEIRARFHIDHTASFVRKSLADLGIAGEG